MIYSVIESIYDLRAFRGESLQMLKLFSIASVANWWILFIRVNYLSYFASPFLEDLTLESNAFSCSTRVFQNRLSTDSSVFPCPVHHSPECSGTPGSVF